MNEGWHISNSQFYIYLPKGLELWDDDSPQIKIIETTKPFSALEISSSGSRETWSFLLTVDASVKIRFLQWADLFMLEANNKNKRENGTKKHFVSSPVQSSPFKEL